MFAGLSRIQLLSILLVGVLAMPSASYALKIGVVLAGNSRSFWPMMQKGIEDAAKNFNATVVIRSTFDDHPEYIKSKAQLAIIRWMVDQKVDTLLLAPLPLIEASEQVKIPMPVILIDRDSKNFDAKSTISTDNYAAGKAAAYALKDSLPPGSSVGVLRLAAEVTSTSAREKGFIDAAKKIGYKITLDTSLGHGMRESAAAANKALTNHTGPLHGIFTPSGITTIGAFKAIQKMPKEKRPKLVGFDYQADFLEKIKDGSIHALIIQDPYQIGYQAIEKVVQSEGGKKNLAKVIHIPYLVLTQKNLSDPEIKKIISRYK